MGKLMLTSAASAIFLLFSACSSAVPAAAAPLPGDDPPSVLAGPPTLRAAGGSEDVCLGGGGAEARVRPGCAKGSEVDLLQRAPIVEAGWVCSVYVAWVWVCSEGGGFEFDSGFEDLVGLQS
jgi:hypothetical protein